MALKPFKQDVVISAVAAMTPLGLGFEATRRGLHAGEHRLGLVSLPDDEPAAGGVLGGMLPDFEPKAILGSKGLRNKDRSTLIILSAIHHDLAGELERIEDRAEIGLALGTTFGSLRSAMAFNMTYERDGFRALNPLEFPNMVINTPPSQANIRFNLAGGSTTISNMFSAGLDAILFSADQISAGRARYVVAGGADEFILPLALAFNKKGLGSKSGRLAPFDAAADGTLLSEGGAMVLLEPRSVAEERGATPLGEILGYASTFSGSTDYRPTDAGILAKTMEIALEHAQLEPSEIDFIAGSANGDRQADACEALAISQVFGTNSDQIPVVAYKSYWGECPGAGGALQLVGALADLKDQTVSATVNFDKLCTSTGSEPSKGDPEEPKIAVTRTRTEKKLRNVLINSFGFTGHNSCLVVRRSDAL